MIPMGTGPVISSNNRNLREIKPSDVFTRKTPRQYRSDVILPSEYHAYALCTEFAKEWFVNKFPEKFFTSIYVDGSYSFDEFRKFSDMSQLYRRTPPLLAIVPSIDMEHNRNWIDSSPEGLPGMLRRSRYEGVIFSDIRDNRGLHLALQMKSILMKFLYKMRVNTKGEQMDLANMIKFKHRAGFTESVDLTLDIHVPKQIIAQIAFDNAICMKENGEVIDNVSMLNYLNTYSRVPFLYKLRCATGNDEYFIKVPHCVAHIKSELPQVDEGDRVDMVSMNYGIEFGIEIEMSAPYCYTYYSQSEIKEYLNRPTMGIEDTLIQQHIVTELPREDENHWQMLTSTEYEVDDEDLKKPLEIDFDEFFHTTGDIGVLIDYTKSISVSPSVFMHLIMYNGGIELEYDIDWNTLKCVSKREITHNRTIIGIYVDMKYVNETIIYLEQLKTNPSRIV